MESGGKGGEGRIEGERVREEEEGKGRESGRKRRMVRYGRRNVKRKPIFIYVNTKPCTI